MRRIDLHLTPVFAHRRMAGITTADTRSFISARLDAKASPGEIDRELALIKRMYALAIQAGKLLTRPYVPMLAENNVRTGFFDREQIDSVIGHLPEALRPMVTFAYITGWRIPSEVLTLQWRQVDLEAGTVRLDPVRAGVSEHVAMKLSGHKTASMFRWYDIVSDSDLVDATEKLQAASANARAADPRLRLGVAVLTHEFRRSADPLGSCPAVGCMLATDLHFSATLR